MKRLAILGSTGSIGTQALDVAEKLGMPVTVLGARRNIKMLEEQIRKFKPELVAVMEEEAAALLKTAVADCPVRIVTGMEGFEEAASYEGCDIVLNSVVGMVGIRPTMAAIKARKILALANKETLVAGGSLIMKTAEEYGVKILPVDSEHSAIFQCLQGCPDKSAFKSIILTASGGPFFGKTRAELADVTREQALKHPNWSMGAKITIDSATLMNKGLEVIEAVWLFDKSPDDIEIVVHRESIIHSAVVYADNSVIAQMGVPDMRIPIQYAITYPNRCECPVKPLSLTDIGGLSFYKPDMDTFKCLRVCIDSIKAGGLRPAAANGANEAAVGLFLEGKIKFLEIGELVEKAALAQPAGGAYRLEDIFEADKRARELVYSLVK